MDNLYKLEEARNQSTRGQIAFREDKLLFLLKHFYSSGKETICLGMDCSIYVTLQRKKENQITGI